MKLTEFGLIERLKKKLNSSYLGDDAAVIAGGDDRSLLQLITTDTLVENVHFTFKYFSWRKLGWKIMAVNISDIAAMAGLPTYALVTLGLNPKVKVKNIDDFYAGMQKLARKHKIQIIGGDLVAANKVFVSLTLLGQVEPEYLLKRSGAKVGDLICVTGKLGAAAASKYRILPRPRVKAARRIAAAGLATAMIDNSDGLARSVAEICQASGVGAEIYAHKIPLAKGATLEDALYGGEDYELIYTVKAKAEALAIGKIVAKSRGLKLDGEEFKNLGWDHFE